MATYAAERYSEQTAQAVASKANTANVATLATSNKGDKQSKTYTDTKFNGLSGDLAASVETSEVISPNIWSKNALVVTDETGKTYLFSVNSPDSPSAAMFRVPVSINGSLTVSDITSGNIDMSSGMLTVNSIQGSKFLLGNDGSADFASVKTTANAAVGKDLSVAGKTAVGGDFYAGANGDGTYGLQYNFAPGDTVRSLTLDGPISASEIRIGTATTLNKDSFSTDTITANVALVSKGTLSVAGDATLAGMSATNIIDSGTLSAGASTLAATTVDSLTDKGSLTVKGDSTLANVKAGDVSAGNVAGTNFTASGTLQVAGASTLAAISVTDLTDSGTLTVVGDTTVAKLTAEDATVKSLTNKGDLTVVGSSNLAAVTTSGKLTVNNDADVTGDLTVGGELHHVAISGGTLTASDLNVTTITATGAISGGSLKLTDGVTATSLNAETGPITGGSLNVGSGPITGGSLNAGGVSITGGAITGTLLDLSGGDITNAGTIMASALNVGTLVVTGGNMSVDVNGNLTVNTLKLTNGTARVKILAGTQQSDPSTYPLPQGSVIVATPTSDPGSYWWVDSSTGVINLAAPALVDVTFDCIAVNN
ncbi:MAG: hypothetical protein FWF45_06130 [Coriobacteriia bacterium]|nr:hypothetical protein [Coriobacteriia bacterium]